VDDGIVDGTQTVTITASAAAHADGFDTVDVTDNDTPELTWAIDDESVSESDGPVATIATVSRNTDTTEELTVTLESSDISEITIPAPSSSVTIAAGESTSSPFNIQAIDDDIVDGTQTVTLTASANLHADGASSLDVTDDDVATLFLVLAETSVSEEDGEGATTATVFRNTDTSSELIVSLSFDDTSEATVQASVTIAAGETTSPPFSINAVQDLIEDETQTAILEATADGFVDGTASLEITNSSDTNFYVIPTTGGGTVIIEL
jgi:secreted trypsin-like serine protease